MKNLAGQKFHRLTAIRPAGRAKSGNVRWLCRCECGNEKIVTGPNLQMGTTKSCGCFRSEVKTVDIQGQRFGRLLVRREAGSNARGHKLWECLCDCGTEKVVLGRSLRSGKIVSCGCKRREVLGSSGYKHGGCGTRTFRAWQEMLRRCFDPGRPGFKDYGARGITVCEEWRNDFAAFRDHMGECPPGLTLERIDVDGNYEPGNCRWATHQEQAENTRKTIYVEAFGERVKLLDACRARGLKTSMVRDRIFVLGWTPEQALTTPKKINGTKFA